MVEHKYDAIHLDALLLHHDLHEIASHTEGSANSYPPLLVLARWLASQLRWGDTYETRAKPLAILLKPIKNSVFRPVPHLGKPLKLSVL